MSDTISQAKEEGNKLFKQSKFDLAIVQYSNAIQLIDQQIQDLENQRSKSNDKNNNNNKTQNNGENEKESLDLDNRLNELEHLHSILLTNRALCKLSLKQFEESIQDSTLAIESNEQWTKAYWCLAKANMNLKKWKDAKRALGDGLDIILTQIHLLTKKQESQQSNESLENERKKLTTTTTNNKSNKRQNSSKQQRKQKQKSQPPVVVGSLQDLESKKQEFYKEYDQAEQRYVESYFQPLTKDKPIRVELVSRYEGKGVFAENSFNFAQTIFIEKPAVSHRFVNEEKEKKVESENSVLEQCDYCMRRPIRKDQLGEFEPVSEFLKHRTLIECQNCHMERYCGENCQKEAYEKYHKILCFKPEGPTTTQSIAYRVLLDYTKKLDRTNVMIIIRSLAMGLLKYQKGIPVEDCFSELEVFVANGVAGERDEELLKYFKECVKADVNDPHENIVNIGNWRLINGAILRNTQQIAPVSELAELLQERTEWEKISKNSKKAEKVLSQFSSFEDLLEKKSDFLKQLEPRAGSGLFVLGNSMNHSCRPNCVVMTSSSDFHIRLVALRKIHKGEELTFSYIDESQPFMIRQKQLMERYLFRCKCERCKQEAR